MARQRDSMRPNYMKFPCSALSILGLCAALAGCGTFGLPDFTKKDEVPPEVRAEPVIIDVPPQNDADRQWPHVGTVPFMPKDFSPKPVYDHYMNELEYDRDESVAAKKDLLDNSPVVAEPLVTGSSVPAGSVPSASLAAPQFQVK